MLPFLKNRDEGSMSAPIEVIEREPDEGSELDLLSAVAEDMIKAIERKDKKLLKDALAAFAEHLKEEDKAEDDQQMKGIE